MKFTKMLFAVSFFPLSHLCAFNPIPIIVTPGEISGNNATTTQGTGKELRSDGNGGLVVVDKATGRILTTTSGGGIATIPETNNALKGAPFRLNEAGTGATGEGQLFEIEGGAGGGKGGTLPGYDSEMLVEQP